MIFRKKLKRGQLELASLVHSLLEKMFFISVFILHFTEDRTFVERVFLFFSHELKPYSRSQQSETQSSVFSTLA